MRLTSRHGQVGVRALVTDRVHGNQLYMPMNSTESPVNRLTGSHSDPITHTPAYKEAAVRLEVLPQVDESPLPRINSRALSCRRAWRTRPRRMSKHCWPHTKSCKGSMIGAYWN